MENIEIKIGEEIFIIKKVELTYHIRKFLEKVVPSMEPKYIENLQNKLNTLNIKHSNLYLILDKIFDNYKMEYNEKNNTIKYNMNYIYLIYQKLFEVATTYVEGKDIHQGLYYANEKMEVGAGFNCGYTLLLSEIYFCDENKGEFYGKHEKSKSIMKKIDSLLGHEAVLECYMMANLKKFYSLLSKYLDDIELYDFTNIMDEMYLNEEIKDYIKAGSLYQKALVYVKKIENAKTKDSNMIKQLIK